MRKFFVLLAFTTLVLGSVVLVFTFPSTDFASYVGSSECSGCHGSKHRGWMSSLHSKMMTKVDTLQHQSIVANLDDEDLLFDPNEIVWAVGGGKWEQQFMGESDGHETLLPGVWLAGKEQWKKTGWDGWQNPNPVERCHGCHTVGLDVETGAFVEASIGCESCHGPGSWHVSTRGLGSIYSGNDSQVCGQCHTRGYSMDNQYFFPVGYKPGKELFDYLKEEEPDYIQNSSKWWANGHPRKRHQEYYSWREDGHVNSLKSLTENYAGQYGEVNSKCLSCHAAEAINHQQSEHFNLDEVEYGITCNVCHNSHGDLDKPRLECDSCHVGGASYHNPEENQNHIPCPVDANVQCKQCHMPLTAFNGGDYTLHSHKASIIPPSDTEAFGVPNSCANGGCHKDSEQEWLESMFNEFYLSKTREVKVKQIEQ